jgi:hypothetical protein
MGLTLKASQWIQAPCLLGKCGPIGPVHFLLISAQLTLTLSPIMVPWHRVHFRYLGSTTGSGPIPATPNKPAKRRQSPFAPNKPPNPGNLQPPSTSSQPQPSTAGSRIQMLEPSRLDAGVGKCEEGGRGDRFDAGALLGVPFLSEVVLPRTCFDAALFAMGGSFLRLNAFASSAFTLPKEYVHVRRSADRP